MANDHWLSAYYVTKFISSTNNRRLSISSQSAMVPSKESSMIVRALTLDPLLRRKVRKERKKAYREGLEAGIITKFLWTSKVRNVSQDIVEFDDSDDEWSTEEENEEKVNEVSKSALVRQKRLEAMADLPECFDKDMAERLKILKKVTTKAGLRKKDIITVFPGWKKKHGFGS